MIILVIKFNDINETFLYKILMCQGTKVLSVLDILMGFLVLLQNYPQ